MYLGQHKALRRMQRELVSSHKEMVQLMVGQGWLRTGMSGDNARRLATLQLFQFCKRYNTASIARTNITRRSAVRGSGVARGRWWHCHIRIGVGIRRCVGRNCRGGCGSIKISQPNDFAAARTEMC